MKTRALVILAAVVVPVTVTATRVPHDAGPAPVALATAVTSSSAGTTSFVLRRTKTAGCTLGPLPDRACSPGAFERGRTTHVICSASFHTSDVRAVPDSLKHQVEVEYGLEPKRYGNTLEIDHIISLELGGANDIANLYPELGPGYHTKDVLENQLHKLVCTGKMTLHTAQRRIAADWVRFYKTVTGTEPVLTGDMPPKR